MARDSYQEGLLALRQDILDMADLALERYGTAVDVLESGDAEKARRVIEGDFELNEEYLDIEGDCIDLLALQQPVAGDLRFIASSFKIVTDIERIGDLATNLARYGRDGGGEQFHTTEVRSLATDASDMVVDAMRGYEDEDAEVAREVAARDNNLDERCRAASQAVVRDLMTTPAGEETDVESEIQRASNALLTIRDIERVGDHAVNISARTLYMVENDDELIF